MFADDDVFYPDDAGRSEYVLNSTGLIYMGTSDQVTERGWVYGQVGRRLNQQSTDPPEPAVNLCSLLLQFEEGILDACIYIMDACRMPIHNRGDVVKMVRTASALVRRFGFWILTRFYLHQQLHSESTKQALNLVFLLVFCLNL